MLCIIAPQSFGLKPIWGPWKAQLHVPLPARSGLLIEVKDIGEQIRRMNVEPMIPVAIRLSSLVLVAMSFVTRAIPHTAVVGVNDIQVVFHIRA